MVLLHGLNDQGLFAGELLEAAVLVLELLDPPDLGDPQAAVHLLPAVEGLLADVVLLEELLAGATFLRFAKNRYDLLWSEPFPSHCAASLSLWKLTLGWPTFQGKCH